MCKQKATLQQMKGKVLQVAHLGSIILPLLQNGLLDGLPPKTYFRITRSPTQPSAVLAVQLGKADATVAPMTTSGLKPLFDGISVPPPAFVALDPRLPAALVQKATTAMVSRKETLAGISGWGSVDASAYQSLVARSKRKVHRMELTSVQGIPLPHRDLLAIDPLHLELPELQASFVIP